MDEIITRISQVADEVTWFFRNLGFSNYYIIKIYDLVGDASISLTEDNPYWLLQDFPRMGFKTVDEVAFKLGFDESNPERVKSAIKYALAHEVSEGNTYGRVDEIALKVGEFTGLNSSDVKDVLEDMVFDGDLQLTKLNGVELVYFYGYYRAECGVCGKLAALENPENHLAIPKDIDFYIRKSQIKNGTELSDEQVKAVKNSLLSGVSIITGGPGTGKTTVIKALIDIFEEQGFKVAVAAPTGRAAKRIMETSGHYAQTVHRLLEYSFDEIVLRMRFMRDENNPLDYKVIIVDEASMMDILLCEALVKAVQPDTRIIFVGDSDQLPSVGAGNVLRDLIDSEYFFTSNLKEIHRQSMESAIVMNAHRINRGEYPEFADDFELVELQKQADIADKLVEIASEYDIDKVQVLTPVKKGTLGIEELNPRLQEVFNPKSDEKPEITFGKRIFRLGDRVMQTRNNYNLGVFNGEVGIIKAINAEDKEITVLYDDDRFIKYAYVNFEELELSYAVTIHKSQGSEYPVVIIPMTWFPGGLATRSLIYTAITRGKEKVYIVGEPKYLNAMVDNDKSRERNSGLKDRLIMLYQ